MALSGQWAGKTFSFRGLASPEPWIQPTLEGQQLREKEPSGFVRLRLFGFLVGFVRGSNFTRDFCYGQASNVGGPRAKEAVGQIRTPCR